MYQNVLFATEFTETANIAGKKVKKIAEALKAMLNLIHVVELPTIDIFPDIPDKEKLYVQEAKGRLAGVGKNLNVPPSQQYLEVGNPRVVIPEFVEQHHIDLLVVGHHERQGIDRILGSTTYALLERMKCEVLVIPYSLK
jgi:universal stress protein A